MIYIDPPYNTGNKDFFSLTKQVAGPKIDGLYKYIKKENKKGKKLFGGIVTNTDPHEYKGRWIYFDKTSKEFLDSSFENWNDLIL